MPSPKSNGKSNCKRNELLWENRFLSLARKTFCKAEQKARKHATIFAERKAACPTREGVKLIDWIHNWKIQSRLRSGTFLFMTEGRRQPSSILAEVNIIIRVSLVSSTYVVCETSVFLRLCSIKPLKEHVWSKKDQTVRSPRSSKRENLNCCLPRCARGTEAFAIQVEERSFNATEWRHSIS